MTAGNVEPDQIPEWLQPLVGRVARRDELPFPKIEIPEAWRDQLVAEPRSSAVLILFGEGPDGPDLLLVRRATWLRKHAGQPAFPGGGVDPGDVDAVATALREAEEETGLDPAGVVVLGRLKDLSLPVSNSAITPVVGWWRTPSEVFVADGGEIAAVARVPLRELADPDSRGVVTHYRGASPAFDVRGMIVWGFTGLIISGLLGWLGLERPWDDSREFDLPPGDAGPSPFTVDE